MNTLVLDLLFSLGGSFGVPWEKGSDGVEFLLIGLKIEVSN